MISEQDIAVAEPKEAVEKREAGTILKERRIELGLTQKQIADRLRLRITIIEGIEENNFESGQVATFIRGYLRSYAKAVNIDESIVLSALADCGEAQHQEQQMMSFSRKTKRERHDSRIMMVTWGILAIIIAISSIWWWQNQLQDTLVVSSSEESSQIQFDDISEADKTVVEVIDPVQSELPAVLPEPVFQEEVETLTDEANKSLAIIEDSSATGVVEVETEQPQAIDSADAVTPAAELESNSNDTIDPVGNLRPLTMSFNADCWIQVKDASGKVLSTGIKKAGQSLNLEAESPLSIILGAPESVSMTFASEPVDLSGYTSGKVARFTLP
ncbi:cytoskeleton protein RodZ [uncultured Vibrio sp.]|uniref:cytoskeleton protein RodZ n=1 Tax=uncultured Vibrio sp. TaxID=114054 RepID=UPI00091EED98|nr:cytoskeleton protein RodZ [uncultured Vibrio sp.]OIQ26068.1 MAG: helix-turn-helix domain-containing protein [Vibrio sp. MedPE-SWchi]